MSFDQTRGRDEFLKIRYYKNVVKTSLKFLQNIELRNLLKTF